jgi:hypothetical protein
VFERYEDGITIGGVLTEMGDSLEHTAIQGPIEGAVVDLIGDQRTPALEKVA